MFADFHEEPRYKQINKFQSESVELNLAFNAGLLFCGGLKVFSISQCSITLLRNPWAYTCWKVMCLIDPGRALFIYCDVTLVLIYRPLPPLIANVPLALLLLGLDLFLTNLRDRFKRFAILNSEQAFHFWPRRNSWTVSDLHYCILSKFLTQIQLLRNCRKKITYRDNLFGGTQA